MVVELQDALSQTRKAMKVCQESLEARDLTGPRYSPSSFDVPTVIYALRALMKAEYHLMRVQPAPPPDVKDIPF